MRENRNNMKRKYQKERETNLREREKIVQQKRYQLLVRSERCYKGPIMCPCIIFVSWLGIFLFHQEVGGCGTRVTRFESLTP